MMTEARVPQRQIPPKSLAAGRTIYRDGSWACPQPAWMKRIVVGSVITNGGAWRVVREVSRYRNGDLRSVTVTIRRCSWTHRCYTIINANDMRQFGFRLMAVKRRKLNRRIDRKIRRAIEERCTQKSMTCCDVEGVA